MTMVKSTQVLISNALYSTYAEDQTTNFYFLDFHATSALSRKIQIYR